MFDVVVAGGTPAGIAAAVRVARAGHRVCLTQHTQHVGGMCSNGLCQWDAHSNHRRCPIFAEILDRLETWYRETYGPESAQHRAARYTMGRYPIGSYEPSVIERIFEDMLRETPGITCWRGVAPLATTVEAGAIVEAVFAACDGSDPRRVRARIFIDATYEGDLAACAGAPYRVGREAATEYDEPHAGYVLTRLENHTQPGPVADGRLQLFLNGNPNGKVTPVDPASPRHADNHIQAYNLRPCVCRDPARRLLLEKPPEGYDAALFRHYRRDGLTINAHINDKNSYNSPILPGANWEYPEGDWATRAAIAARHREMALGWMWYLQNDPAVPASRREQARTWGLPTDEFADNDHLPYEMYVREARRIVGRHVLTENDLASRPQRMRPRPFADAIAFTDWYMDSHSCGYDLGTYGAVAGVCGTEAYPFDGKMSLTADLRPGMIPYRSLVTAEIANLIVPVCASATHVAWGAIRLEPVWIHLGEVAGFAACQAMAHEEAINTLDVDRLQNTLLQAGAAIAFFNQHSNADEHPRYADRQLAACHGEWDSYDV